MFDIFTNRLIACLLRIYLKLIDIINLEYIFSFFKESRMTWTETVKSEQLREQFNSFTVEINNNKQSCSFVGELFKNDFKQELETEIKSLAQRVLLTKNFERTDSLQPMETAVYEVDVTSNDNKLSVTEKVIFYNENPIYIFCLLFRCFCLHRNQYQECYQLFHFNFDLYVCRIN